MDMKKMGRTRRTVGSTSSEWDVIGGHHDEVSQRPERNPTARLNQFFYPRQSANLDKEPGWFYMGIDWMVWLRTSKTAELEKKGFSYDPNLTRYYLKVGEFLRLETMPSLWKIPDYKAYVGRVLNKLPLRVFWNFKNLNRWIRDVQKERHSGEEHPKSLAPVLNLLVLSFHQGLFESPHPATAVWLPGVQFFPPKIKRQLLGSLIQELQYPESFKPNMPWRPHSDREKIRNRDIKQRFDELRSIYGLSVDDATEILEAENPGLSEVNLRKIAGTTQEISYRHRQ